MQINFSLLASYCTVGIFGSSAKKRPEKVYWTSSVPVMLHSQSYYKTTIRKTIASCLPPRRHVWISSIFDPRAQCANQNHYKLWCHHMELGELSEPHLLASARGVQAIVHQVLSKGLLGKASDTSGRWSCQSPPRYEWPCAFRSGYQFSRDPSRTSERVTTAGCTVLPIGSFTPLTNCCLIQRWLQIVMCSS